MTIPLLIAHRGARLEAPENTLPAFARAIELGADGIEFDVRLTRDRVPVISHDEHIHDEQGHLVSISATPYEILRTIAIGARKGAEFRGTVIPTLEEALAFLAPHNLQLIVEIKRQSDLHDDAVRRVGDALHHAPLKKSPIVSSASRRIHHALYRHHRDLQRALIVVEPLFSFVPSLLFAKFYGLQALHLEVSGLKKIFVEACHRLNLQCVLWTVRLARQLHHAVQLGVDAIIADDVALIRREMRSLNI